MLGENPSIKYSKQIFFVFIRKKISAVIIFFEKFELCVYQIKLMKRYKQSQIKYKQNFILIRVI